ncbi:YicC family protein [Marinicaulis flavus]|uniref:YicC family protein n=2 Tax=Hyphococcus luteus TaxID=2058213 RepID=A0A2S7JZH8_9PROT|nr:YicC family protein [Marinicaulis flavus]
MTGFARAEGAHEGWRFVWEVRSVNGRGLEWRARLPPGYDALDPEMRKLAKQKLSRGSLNIGLTLASDRSDSGYRINEAMLADAVSMINKLRLNVECAPPSADGLLGLRGVIEQAEEELSAEAREALFAALLNSFGEALDALVAARRKEGASMGAVIAGHFETIEKLTADAAANAAAMPAAIRDRIAAQLKELLDGAVPEDRLAQEASLLAIKADVREELDRLSSHVSAGRALLAREGPVGRDLDFLTQEFNREANTLCSKAQDMELKRIGLELKRVIDQLREQVQNIE